MRRFAIAVLAILTCLAPSTLHAQCSLGPNLPGAVLPAERDDCTGQIAVHHDYGFENGLCWQHEGTIPEYYGCFGEAYDLGSGTIVCGAFWLSTILGAPSQVPSNVYVWEHGVSSEPGAVLFVQQGVQWSSVPYWPTVGENLVPINLPVSGDFTIGYWPDLGDPPGACGYWCTSDETGPIGFPWTYIKPDEGYPSGWQSVTVVDIWSETHSLGIGVYFDDSPTPALAPTWGSVKTLFK